VANAPEFEAGSSMLKAKQRDDGSSEKFVCRRCGGCCRGEGYVWLTDDDIERISTRLRITRKEFVKRYARRIAGTGDIALIDKDDAVMSCVFLEADGCAIHESKPVQCVGFPTVWDRSDMGNFCEAFLAEAPEDDG
jgi:Fe-S-cluster containining protein